MIKTTVTFKDGTTETWLTTLDYALHTAGSLLIDPSVAGVSMEYHTS